ncbi:DinB family protein [Paenibacillus sp. FA6]|uniref:DinB family protein n=1 Tax=Paenibacillus sp. FA6 TaxID=3413029 RepID=UPI003F6555C1
MSQMIINTSKLVRQTVIKQVEAIPENLFDIQPTAFNNTIRWNIGHIIGALNGLLSRGGFTLDSSLPESYSPLFLGGSKPSDWTITPPSKEELLKYLNEQLQALSEISPNVLDNILAPPLQLGPMKFERFGELFNFTSIHETMHSNTISCLLKVILHEQG